MHDGTHKEHVTTDAALDRAFRVGLILNGGFVVVELAAGVLSGSLALIADAGHNVSDILGLVVAWVALRLSRRAPTPRFTYGLRGSSILAALFNAVFLMIAAGAIAWEAIGRLTAPGEVTGWVVVAVAAVGIGINGATAALLASGRGDLNVRAAFVHMLADAAVSAGVVVGGLAIMATGRFWIDPAVSLIVVAVIVWSNWSLFRGSFALGLDAVPEGIDPAAVRGSLERMPGVADVQDLHIWPLSTREAALTAHLLMPGGAPGDSFLVDAARMLSVEHGIDHVTLQVVTDPATMETIAQFRSV
jgi:cobalt-zinc-cadmium efflux system protein